MTDPALRAVVFLMASFSAIIFGLFVAALLRGRRKRRQRVASEHILPEINHELVAYLAGSNDLERLREFRKSAPRELSHALFAYEKSLAGSARDRLCDLTLQLGLLHEWREEIRSRDPLRRHDAYTALAFVTAYEPCRRVTDVILADALDHSDRHVRMIAARALALYGDEKTVIRVFEMAVRDTLLARILLAEQLRPHALELCRTALAAALESNDPQQILGALEIIVAWERALPLGGIAPHLGHEQRAIRLAALRAAPLTLASPELEAAVTRCLSDSGPEIAMAASAAAARLRIQSALPLLEQCLRAEDAGLARTAAAALASLPPGGWKALEETAASGGPIARGAAAEALGRLRPAGAV